MNRRILPQRRRAETFDLVFRNQLATVTIGYFPDGSPGEIFVDAAKSGDIAHIARDAAIMVSIALQHGASTATLKHALTRDSAGGPASILGVIVDALPATRSISGDVR
jgi:ribonucleoside-diphosphate reductase alpha chain